MISESQEASMDQRTHAWIAIRAVELEAAVDAISSRGRMAFRKDPKVRERFMALISTAGPSAEDLVPEPAPATAPTEPEKVE
jgi:hypothetical protein